VVLEAQVSPRVGQAAGRSWLGSFEAARHRTIRGPDAPGIHYDSVKAASFKKTAKVEALPDAH
jgi:hypothetical protein